MTDIFYKLGAQLHSPYLLTASNNLDASGRPLFWSLRFMVQLIEDFDVKLDECPCCGREICHQCKKHNVECRCGDASMKIADH